MRGHRAGLPKTFLLALRCVMSHRAPQCCGMDSPSSRIHCFGTVLGWVLVRRVRHGCQLPPSSPLLPPPWCSSEACEGAQFYHVSSWRCLCLVCVVQCGGGERHAQVWWHVCLCCDLQKLDEEELEEVREAFNLFDTDGNGTCARFLWHLACLLLLLLLLLWGRKRAS